jgi:hypothetical protein
MCIASHMPNRGNRGAPVSRITVVTSRRPLTTAALCAPQSSVLKLRKYLQHKQSRVVLKASAVMLRGLAHQPAHQVRSAGASILLRNPDHVLLTEQFLICVESLDEAAGENQQPVSAIDRHTCFAGEGQTAVGLVSASQRAQLWLRKLSRLPRLPLASLSRIPPVLPSLGRGGGTVDLLKSTIDQFLSHTSKRGER